MARGRLNGSVHLPAKTLASTAALDALWDVGRAMHPAANALVSARATLTWEACDRLTTRWAQHLRVLGLRPGDRVASLMPNRPALLLHYLGCWKAGLVVAPLNYRYTPAEIDHALGVIDASLLLAHAERQVDVEASRECSRLPLGVLRFADVEDGEAGLGTLLSGSGASLDGAAVARSDPAAIFFTSGSTGLPKGVTHSFATLGAMIASAGEAFEMTPADIVLPASSLSHLGAFLFSLAALSRGAGVVVSGTSDGDEILPLLRRYRPTVLAMIPAALTALVRDHGAAREDFASLRLCRAGADKVAAELEREFIALSGFPIDEGYGMTEMGLATLSPPSGEIRVGSIGTPNPGYELSIRDEEGVEVAPGIVGRLWVRSPALTIGYWRQPEATAEVLRDGWLDTGDLMRADEQGYLWFFGRKKQIIVHDGSNVSPQEVEAALAEHPAVALSGVVGVHDSVHGENVRAYVALREEATAPTAQELIRFARERVGYKAPEEIVFLADIPLNPTGKVDRTALKRLAEDHLDAHPRP